MIKVLLITARADYGGGPEHVWQLIKGLGGHRFEMFVACPEDEPYFERFVQLVGKCNIIKIPHRAFSFQAFVEMRRVIKRNQVDVIHSHGKGAGLYSRLIALLTPTLIIIHTFHGLHIGQYAKWKRFLYIYYERFAGKITRTLVSVSGGERQRLIQAHVCDANKLVVIPNGIPVDETCPVRAANKAPAIVMVVMRFDFQKNPDLLLTIIELMAGQYDDGSALRFEILGDGPDRPRFEAHLADRGLAEMCAVRGSVDDVRVRLSQALVYLSTSRWEGLPIAMLEAMAEGVPIVATDVVGNRDLLLHGVSGYLFDPKVPQDAVTHLLHAAGIEGDRLARRAHALVKSEYGIERMLNDVCSLYAACPDRLKVD